MKPKGAPPAPPAEIVVATPEDLAQCLEELRRQPTLGLDTEFIGEQSYHPHLCLVQVATPHALYLIDPLSAGSLDAFWEIVVDPERTLVVHAGREEVRLCYLACGKAPTNLVDLQLAAGLVGLTYPLGHGNLAKEILGISLSKGETLTEWGKRPLTKSQMHYAYDDVRHLLAIWDKLSASLDKLGRHAWLAEESQRLIAAATPTAPAEMTTSEKWRKLRGCGSLDRRRLGIVRELFNWREEAAARVNRPPRTLVRDDLLVEIARRSPQNARDLHVVRGLPRRDLEAIVAAVARGRELPAESLPTLAERDLDPPQVAMVVSIMQAVLGDLSARDRLASNLVATTTDIKLLVRAHVQSESLPGDCALAAGWRAEHVLPQLRAVLEGKRSLRVADARADAPFAYHDS